MYLFTFVFLLMAIVGLFTQVFALQTNRVMSQNTNVADRMVAWHSMMVQAVTNRENGPGGFWANPALNASSEMGCWLLQNFSTSGGRRDETPENVPTGPGSNPSVQAPPSGPRPICYMTRNEIPTGGAWGGNGNDTGEPAFLSIAYTVSMGARTMRAIITFVPVQITSRPDQISEYSGISNNQLFRQMQRTRLSSSQYGFTVRRSSGNCSYVLPNSAINAGAVAKNTCDGLGYGVPQYPLDAGLKTGTLALVTIM